MNKNLRWRILLTLAVLLVFGSVGVYPILAARYHLPAPQILKDRQLRLGLDLKGGVHLVMRVQTDDALKLTTQTTADRLREALAKANVTVGNVNVLTLTSFRVEGVPPGQDAEFRRLADEEAGAQYNRQSGAGAYTFEMRPNVVTQQREDTVVQAMQTIDRRINELGVTEPTIARQGTTSDELLVQLPGVADVGRAKDIIGRTALLELKLVEQGPAPTREALLQTTNNTVPGDMEVVQGAAERGAADAGTVYYLVRKVPVITGRDLRAARPTLDENGQPAVSFSLNREGSRKFSKATGENIGRLLAIILDERVQSAPRIDGRISDEGRISGSFTQQETADLALILRSGALPAALTYLQEEVIGPTLGQDSIRSGIIASVVGLVLVILFMLVYYKLSGVNAVIAMVMNLIILLGLMAYLGAVMTLPGIAGFILTMGIGVDSNVLIFERIKEELAAQRGVRASVNAGFSRVFLTLLDTHICALISAAFLFQFGTGPIRGFATTLSVGLLSNLFTSTFVSKTIYEMVLSRRQVTTLSI